MLGRVFLGRYEPIRLLGEGGMGRVYLARQLDLKRQVVVKVMHDHIAADPKFRECFQRETLLMARFQHPYAVTLYDASLDDPKGPCIVMEYVRGVTLDTVLQNNGRLSPARVGRILFQLCEVLQAAHNVGIIHRDLKPANLMVVDADTPYELLKVMDFGLAKLVAPDMASKASLSLAKYTLSNTEFAVGTPGYMCPEQARGDPMDQRGDLYSVGVILYELLTGRLPFSGKATMDLLLAHATEEAPAFADIGANGLVPPGVEEVVRSCLAKDPQNRPRNAREVAERYEQALLADERPQAPLPPVAPSAPANPWVPSPAVRPPVESQTIQVPVVADTEEDPLAVVHHLEAWMPETIATYKLRGFMQDAGGQVIESVPGRIRVRLGGRGSVYSAPRRSSLSWLGLGRRPEIDLELRLHRSDNGRGNHLRITVLFRSPDGDHRNDTGWRSVCTQIFCDLRGYLMGQSHPGTINSNEMGEQPA